jgi:hypothetical protein
MAHPRAARAAATSSHYLSREGVEEFKSQLKIIAAMPKKWE